MPSNRMRWTLAIAATFALLPGVAHAQAWTPMKGHGAVTLGAQYTRIMKHLFSVDMSSYVDPGTGYAGGPGGQMYLGDIVGQTTMLSADYAPLNRLAVSAQAAYVMSSYHGLLPEADMDNGKLHGALQDLILGARYRLPVTALALTPFMTYRTPLTHYSNLGHSALGLGLDETTLGLAAGRTLEPLLPQVAVQASYGRSFVSGLHGFDLDRNVYTAEAAYFVTRSLTMSGGFSYAEAVDGFDWWWMEATMEAFMDHDVASRSLSRRGDVGASLRLGPLFSIGADYAWTISGSNTHAVQGVTLSVSRNISTAKRM